MEKKEVKKTVYVKNFVAFESFEDGGEKIKIITDDKGNELGFEVRGQLTEFGVRNANGYCFDAASYDKFVDSYLAKNRLNVPMNIKHNDFDFQHVAGKVKSLIKTDKGVEIVGFVPRWVYAYNWIKNAVKDGVLQAFSNYGPVNNGFYDPDTDTLHVHEFSLVSVALVELPGDVSAKFEASNTVFKGFSRRDDETPIEEEKEPVVNEILQTADDFMMNL